MGCIVRAGAVPQERHAWERAGTARYMCAPAMTSCGTLTHWIEMRMVWYGMVWYGDLTGWDWTGRDEMGWDVLCAPEPCRRSATPGRGLAQPGTCVPLP